MVPSVISPDRSETIDGRLAADNFVKPIASPAGAHV
jgi:hypothetical protein